MATRLNFWDHIEVDDSGCWLWTASKQKGYGKYRSQSVHRYTYERYKGPIADGLYVCHKCDVPACCNPDHLFLGTNSDNQRDLVAKGRHYLTLKTHCIRGHEFTPENTYMWRTHRICRSCQRIRATKTADAQ